MSAIDNGRVAARHGIFSKMIETLLTWNEARQTRNALSRLSDRELADIGLSRYEAENLGR